MVLLRLDTPSPRRVSVVHVTGRVTEQVIYRQARRHGLSHLTYAKRNHATGHLEKRLASA
jgi:hypothetical protein